MAARLSELPARVEARRSASQVSTPHRLPGIDSSQTMFSRALNLPTPHASPADSFIDKLAASQMHMVRSARKLRLRGRESHRRSDSGSIASVASADDSDDDPGESLFREFGEAAASAQRELAQAVSEEVESQLADILVCLGEEAAKIEVLSGALARMGVDAPALLRDAGLAENESDHPVQLASTAPRVSDLSRTSPNSHDADAAYARDALANAERIAARADAFLLKPGSSASAAAKPPKPPRRSRDSTGSLAGDGEGSGFRVTGTPPTATASALDLAEMSPEEERARDIAGARAEPASPLAPLTRNIVEEYYAIGRSTPVSRGDTDDEGVAWDDDVGGGWDEDEHAVRARIESWEGEIARSRRTSEAELSAFLSSLPARQTPHERATARDREARDREAEGRRREVSSAPVDVDGEPRRQKSRGLMMEPVGKNGWMQVSQSTF